MKAVIYPFSPRDPILQLTRDFPDIAWSVVASVEDFARHIGDADILVISNRACTPACGPALARAQKLRWIHFTSAGIERGLAVGLPEGVPVTNSTGIKAAMVSEHAMVLLLALARRLP